MCHWHLLGRVRGDSQAPCNAQNSPLPARQHHLSQIVDSAEGEKPFSKCKRVTVLWVVKNNYPADKYSSGQVKIVHWSLHSKQVDTLSTDLVSLLPAALHMQPPLSGSHILTLCFCPSFLLTISFLSLPIECLILPLSFILPYPSQPLSHFLHLSSLPTSFSLPKLSIKEHWKRFWSMAVLSSSPGFTTLLDLSF